MKKANPRHCLFIGAWLLLLPVVTFAHHSVNAFYDQGTVSELDGTITRIMWRNPHVGFVLLTGGAEWELDSTAINSLERSGVTRESFGIVDVMYTGKPYTARSRAVHIHPTVAELVPIVFQDLKPIG